jgi:hypothetical protein
VDRLIVRFLPAVVRERHGDELVEMLSSSTRPVRDRLDVVVAGLGLRLGRSIRPLLVATVIAIAASAFGVLQTIGNLRDGAAELPHHWWSTLMTFALVSSSLAATVLHAAQRRATAWRRRC